MDSRCNSYRCEYCRFSARADRGRPEQLRIPSGVRDVINDVFPCGIFDVCLGCRQSFSAFHCCGSRPA
eukprot:COSAG02_NODE_38731_length_425_cov_1.503067_1_plen_67_part_10